MVVGVLLLACICAQAFYDDTVETHAVVTNVMGFGAVADGVVNDTAAVQSAIDYVNLNGGGDVEVPAGTYLLKGVYLKSNVHLLVDADAVLNLDGGTDGTDGGTMIQASGDVDWVENISIQGVGGRFRVNFPADASKTRFVQLKKVRNFLLSDFTVYGNLSSYSSVVFGPSSFDEATRGMPTQGTMRNASIYNSEYGYGLIQAQACDTVLFTNLFASGGVALRFETGWDKMGELQYGGVFNVVGRNISAYGAKQAVMMAPVALTQGPVDIDGVYGTNCNGVVTIAAGGLRSLENPDIIPGSYAAGSSVRNVTAVFGLTGQYKALPDEIPDEYVSLFTNVEHSVYGAPWLGPSLTAVMNNSENVTVSNVKTHGFVYTPPVKGDGYRLTEEPFTSSDYAVTVAGDFWDATSQLNAGTNWISGNGSVAQIDLTTAESENHALNYWGFELEDNEDATICSDFRYYHASGGTISGSSGEAAFGLLFSTDPDPSVGTNRYCLLTNQGDGLGLLDDALSVMAHTNLNVDPVAGGWSDFFRLKWLISRGETNYQGIPLLYDQDGALLYTGSAVDLGVANGTKIWAGYTTGTNSVGGNIASFSGLDRVEADNFLFEVSYVNEAPVWLESTARTYAALGEAYDFNLRGFVQEPNGKCVLYELLSGPDWLSLDKEGNLTGTPGVFDIGENELEVVAEDYEGLAATNQLIMSVSSALSGSFSLSPEADAGVVLLATDDGNYSTNNYGTSRTFMFQRKNADMTNKVREGYFKFDLSQVPGDQVTNAFLRLKVSETDDEMIQTLWSVDDDNWLEDTITYSNRPAVVSSLASSAIPAVDYWAELNVAAFTQQEWSGDQTLSLGLTGMGGFQAGYHSKDDTPGWRPELVVQTVQTENTAPVSPDSVLAGSDAIAGEAYQFALSTQVTDADGDSLSFRITDGPDWLACGEDGTLSGAPTSENAGLNSWAIQVADGVNPAVAAELNVTVVLDSGWARFVSAHELSGAKGADKDEDGRVDWDEYVFGGDPSDGTNCGAFSGFDVEQGAYIFPLIGDGALTVHVVTNVNLVAGSWGTNVTFSVSEDDGLLHSYTNQFSPDADRLFIKLLVE